MKHPPRATDPCLKDRGRRAGALWLAAILVATTGVALAQAPAEEAVTPTPEEPTTTADQTTLSEYVRMCLVATPTANGAAAPEGNVEQLRATCFGPLPQEVIAADAETFGQVYLHQAILYDQAKIRLLEAAQNQLQQKTQAQVPERAQGATPMPTNLFGFLVQGLEAEQQQLAQVLQTEYGAEAPTLEGTGIGQVVEADIARSTNRSGPSFAMQLLHDLAVVQAAQMDAAETAIAKLDNSTTEDAAVDVLRTHAQLSGVEQLLGFVMMQLQQLGSDAQRAMTGGGPMRAHEGMDPMMTQPPMGQATA